MSFYPKLKGRPTDDDGGQSKNKLIEHFSENYKWDDFVVC